MTESEKNKLRIIIDSHLEKMADAIAEADIDVGYWPDDIAALSDVVMAVLMHQLRLNDYHLKNGTEFK